MYKQQDDKLDEELLLLLLLLQLQIIIITPSRSSAGVTQSVCRLCYGWTVRVQIPVGLTFVSSPRTSRLAVGRATQPPNQGVPGLKQPGRDVNHSHPSSGWNYNSTSLTRHHGGRNLPLNFPIMSVTRRGCKLQCYSTAQNECKSVPHSSSNVLYTWRHKTSLRIQLAA